MDRFLLFLPTIRQFNLPNRMQVMQADFLNHILIFSSPELQLNIQLNPYGFIPLL